MEQVISSPITLDKCTWMAIGKLGAGMARKCSFSLVKTFTTYGGLVENTHFVAKLAKFKPITVKEELL